MLNITQSHQHPHPNANTPSCPKLYIVVIIATIIILIINLSATCSMFSKERGPRCGQQLAKRLEERDMLQPQVFILKGGYKGFKKIWGHDDRLVEKAEKKDLGMGF